METYESLCGFDPQHERQLETWNDQKVLASNYPDSYGMNAFIELCRKRITADLGKFLVELCINPALTIPTSLVVASGSVEGDGARPRPWSPFPWLDLGAALLDYEKHRADSVQAGVVETSISKKVCTGIERAREIHRSPSPVPSHIVILQGIEGVGKTTAAKAKCRLHLAEMRFVPLLGNVNYRSFFRNLSLACGLPSGESLKAEHMKSSVENFLRSRA